MKTRAELESDDVTHHFVAENAVELLVMHDVEPVETNQLERLQPQPDNTTPSFMQHRVIPFSTHKTPSINQRIFIA